MIFIFGVIIGIVIGVLIGRKNKEKVDSLVAKINGSIKKG